MPNGSASSGRMRRILLLGSIALLILILIGLGNIYRSLGSTSLPSNLNAIQLENLKKGTGDWQTNHPSQKGEIQGYTGEDSIDRGGTVHLYVSTKVAEKFSIKIYRLGYYNGLGGRLVKEIDQIPSIPQGYYIENQPSPVNCPTCITNMLDSSGYATHYTEANWKLSYTYTFPAAWLSGMYELMLTEQHGGYQWIVPLIVRDDASHSDILYDYADFTDQAYNLWGGESLYFNLRADSDFYTHAVYVSFNRPFISANGHYDFLGKTYPVARFMEQYGYDVTYTSDVAVSEGLSHLENHKAYVVGGHDEYYSLNERQAVVTAKADNVNLAFFSGNNMYWQIRLLPDTHGNADRIVICYKEDTVPDPIIATHPALATVLWRDPPVNMPEDAVLDLMYTSIFPDSGTLPFAPSRLLQPLRVKNTANWIFAGTGMQDGDLITNVIGYEIDSTYHPKDIPSGDNVTFIGDSLVVNRDGTTVHAYSIVVACAGGNILFNAADVYWGLRLTNFNSSAFNDLNYPVVVSPQLVRITNNVLQRMVAPPAAA
jgi:hypothetical protein